VEGAEAPVGTPDNERRRPSHHARHKSAWLLQANQEGCEVPVVVEHRAPLKCRGPARVPRCWGGGRLLQKSVGQSEIKGFTKLLGVLAVIEQMQTMGSPLQLASVLAMAPSFLLCVASPRVLQ